MVVPFRLSVRKAYFPGFVPPREVQPTSVERAAAQGCQDTGAPAPRGTSTAANFYTALKRREQTRPSIVTGSLAPNMWTVSVKKDGLSVT